MYLHSFPESKRILLSSLPRSGSTWVLKALEKAPNTVGVMEPDHLGDLGLGNNGMHPYFGRGVDRVPEAYIRVFERAFDGKTSEKFNLSKRYLRQKSRNISASICQKKNVVVKSLYSVANTERWPRFFEQQYPIL